LRDKTIGPHLGVITHALEETIGDAGGAARAPSNLGSTSLVDANLEQLGGTAHDGLQLLLGIEVETDDHTKTVPQGGGKQASACRGPHQGKARQGEFDRPGTGPLANDNV